MHNLLVRKLNKFNFYKTKKLLQIQIDIFVKH